ncbi:MAG TPA: glycosyltransferase family 2 protein [Segeticoccus sp.]|nr:glycosyltransferase family 2 protein [Segeticoccus sp.]
MRGHPRLSIGLPVYNAEQYLEQSLRAVLGQTFEDFELIISSNASTDGTDEICREYAREDSRVRFLRQPQNIGASPNHNFVFDQSTAPLFKWVSGDDLYARDLLGRCIAMLDDDPGLVLAHSWTAAIDGEGRLIQALPYPLLTECQRPEERLHSLLFAGDEMPGAIRADDFYGVIRSDVLRKVKPLGSYYHSDVTYMAELALHGRFGLVPEWLYFRRQHTGRALEANPTVRSWCSNLDPRRADRLRNPTVRLVGEYGWENVALIGRSGLGLPDKVRCYRVMGEWMASRVVRRVVGHHDARDGRPEHALADPPLSVPDLVSGQREAS